MKNNTKELSKPQAISILEAAETYFLRNWQPIPIPFKTKKPVLEAWQNFKTADESELAKHFIGKPQNIGVLLGEPSNSLIDIDLDSTDAVKLAAFFLPDTNAVFGRESKPKSHFLYICTDAKTEKFQFNGMIAEIRAGGCQTVFPESVHESGEKITWQSDGEPSNVTFDDLRFAVGKLASACIVSDFWKETKRHDLSLALSGTLLNNGFSFEDATLFIKAVCFAAGDTETDDRLKAVETTFERINSNQTVTGLPTLKQLTSDKAANCLDKWLNLTVKPQSDADSYENEFLKSFRQTEKGLFFVSYEKSKSGAVEEVESFICSPLRVIATGKDDDSNERTQIIEFTDDEGRTRKTSVSLRQLITDSNIVIGEMVASGLIINSKLKYKLIDYLIYSKPEKRLTLVYKTGWQGSSFVLPDTVITGADAPADYLLHGNKANKKLKISGNIEQWRENVARYCVGNSRLIFSVSCAFASVLLPLSSQLGGGFHLRGASSEGKSSALKAAGSVLGGGSSEYGFCETWRGTQNGIEAVAASHNHLLLALDEIKEIKKVEDVGKLIYMLSNGFATSRMNTDSSAKDRKEWKLLFLSSGELSFQDIARETKEQVFGGQEARFVDISASVESGFGIFENLHGFENGAAFSAYLNEASLTYYGAAIREFLQYTANNFQSVKDLIKQIQDKFCAAYVDPKASGEVFRVAERFALAACGGWLASHINITGWSEAEPLEVAETLFKEWLARRGGSGAFDVSDGCRKILSSIDMYSNKYYQDLDNENLPKPQERHGYKRKSDTGEIEFIYTGEQFNVLCKGYNQKKILTELERIGHLKTYKQETSRSKMLRLPLPDHSKRQYVYVITIQNQLEKDDENLLKNVHFGENV